ncbi:hypothetical protein BV898_10840 [Hypsibius exemplaris]|uniref:Uncharacterized protein n=1 Tax=Hypsibius exemplaris TaxID=2072580 RepID=A0A1W0WIC9_HYPEX|nr:hypothetical protein BV898_10840 [Hypsibius exemplaris]
MADEWEDVEMESSPSSSAVVEKSGEKSVTSNVREILYKEGAIISIQRKFRRAVPVANGLTTAPKNARKKDLTVTSSSCRLAGIHVRPERFGSDGIAAPFFTNEAIVRMLDPEGIVCPCSITWQNLLGRIVQNQQGSASQLTHKPGDPSKSGQVVGMTVVVPPMFNRGNSCQPNALAVHGPGTVRPRPTYFIAATDIFVGEKINFHQEAERTPLKCQTSHCLQAIPSDHRAVNPCPSCWAVNGPRLKDDLALMERINKFYPLPVAQTLRIHRLTDEPDR